MVGSLIAETSVTGETQREYIWNGMEPVAQIDQSGTTSLHSDHLYTPRLGTDELQSTVWQWESQAFGEAEPQVEATEVNLRFPGQYRDSETGLFYNWNRYYDPTIGRYVTSDPIGLNGGMNTFGYVGGNPMKYVDPNGLVKCTCSATGGGTRSDPEPGKRLGNKTCKYSCSCDCPLKENPVAYGAGSSDTAICIGQVDPHFTQPGAGVRFDSFSFDTKSFWSRIGARLGGVPFGFMSKVDSLADCDDCDE